MAEIFFNEQKNGYDKKQVDNYIHKVTDEYQKTYKEYFEVSKKYQKSESAETVIKSLDEVNREFQIDTLVEIMKTDMSENHQKLPSEITPPPVLEAESSILSKTSNVVGLEMNLTEIFSERQIKKNKKNNYPNNIKNKNRRSVFNIISDMLFFAAILTVLISLLTSGAKSGEPKTFMGFSYFTVLTSSMQSEIPKGSFILVRRTAPQKLKIGDNITFMRDASTTVTHKIIDIYENYENSGARGFKTKGVNNTDPDKDIVYEANVVGKVIFQIPGAGAAIAHLRANIYIVFIIFGLCVVLSFLVRGLFDKPRTRNKPKIYTNHAV